MTCFWALRETQLAIDSNVAIDVPFRSAAWSADNTPACSLPTHARLTASKRTDQYAYDHAVNVSVHAMVFAFWA